MQGHCITIPLMEHDLTQAEVWFGQFSVPFIGPMLGSGWAGSYLPAKSLLSSPGTPDLGRVWADFSLNFVWEASSMNLISPFPAAHDYLST